MNFNLFDSWRATSLVAPQEGEIKVADIGSLMKH